MWELSLSQASSQFVNSNIELKMTRMESVAFHGAQGKGRGKGFFFLSEIHYLVFFFPPGGIKDL